MPPRRGQPLTEADIPPPLDPPERSSFDSQAAFDQAMAEHPAAAAARMKERRRLKEKLRDQNRDRSGRARPSDAGARELERRRNNPDAAAKHRAWEAARYEAAQPEVTEADMALTSIVDASEARPKWDWLKGAKVSKRARRRNAERKEAELAQRLSSARSVPDEVIVAQVVEELVKEVWR